MPVLTNREYAATAKAARLKIEENIKNGMKEADQSARSYILDLVYEPDHAYGFKIKPGSASSRLRQSAKAK